MIFWKKFLLSILLLWKCIFVNGQIQSGNFFSNYSGILGVGLNPANASYGTHGTDFIGWAVSVDLSNNSFKTDALPLFKKMAVPSTNPFSQQNSTNFLAVLASKYRLGKSLKESGYAFANASVTLPSFLIKKGSKSYGIISSLKSLTSSSHLPPDLAEFLYNGAIPRATQLNQDFNFNNFELISATYADIGFNYSDLLIHGPKSELRAGLNARVLIGFNSIFFHDYGTEYRFNNDTNFHVTNGHFKYGFSIVDGNSDMSKIKPLGLGMAFDFGMMYERQSQSMPNLPNKNKSNIYGDAYDYTPYKYKIGFSITDLGAMRFKSQARYREMDEVNYDWSHIDSLSLSGIFTFDKRVMEKIGADPGTRLVTKDRYAIYMPTKVNLLLDFQLKNPFYLNIQFSQRITFANTLSIHGMNRFSVAPRYETKFFELSLPVSLVEYQYFTYGLYARVGFFYFGTNSIPEILGMREVRNMDVYFGMKINLAHFGKGRTIRL